MIRRNRVLVGKIFKYNQENSEQMDVVFEVLNFRKGIEHFVTVKEVGLGINYIVSKESLESIKYYHEVKQDKNMLKGLEDLVYDIKVLKKEIVKLKKVQIEMAKLVFILPYHTLFEENIINQVEKWEITVKELEKSWRSRLVYSYKRINW